MSPQDPIHDRAGPGGRHLRLPRMAAASAPEKHARDRAKPIAAEPAPERKLGRIAFKPCTLSPPMGAASVEAQCGTLVGAGESRATEGPQDRAQHRVDPRRRIGQPRPDPVFLIAGGPGQSATESFAGMIPDVPRCARRTATCSWSTSAAPASRIRCSASSTTKTRRRPTRSMRCGRCATNRRQPARDAAINCRDQLARKADLRFYTTTDGDPRSRRRARGDRRRPDQPDGRVVRHARRAAVRDALSAAHAHDRARFGSRRTRSTSATISRATSNPRSTCSSAAARRRRAARSRSAIRASASTR